MMNLPSRHVPLQQAAPAGPPTVSAQPGSDGSLSCRLSLLSLCPSLPSGLSPRQSPPSPLPLLVRFLPPVFFFPSRLFLPRHGLSSHSGSVQPLVFALFLAWLPWFLSFFSWSLF